MARGEIMAREKYSSSRLEESTGSPTHLGIVAKHLYQNGWSTVSEIAEKTVLGALPARSTISTKRHWFRTRSTEGREKEYSLRPAAKDRVEDVFQLNS